MKRLETFFITNLFKTNLSFSFIYKIKKINSKTTKLRDVLLPNFVDLLNRTIDEKFHSFQRVNEMRNPKKKTKEFVVMNIEVTFSLEYIGKL